MGALKFNPKNKNKKQKRQRRRRRRSQKRKRKKGYHEKEHRVCKPFQAELLKFQLPKGPTPL
jgi:hypothetical protein